MVATHALTLTAAGSLTFTDRWFRYWMPYCFHELTNVHVGRYKHVYLPLNRNYKPLGQVSRQRVRYEDYVDQAMIFPRNPTTFGGIWTASRDGIFWLYSDSSQSRVDYFERLGRLLSQKVRLVATVMGRDEEAATRSLAAIPPADRPIAP